MASFSNRSRFFVSVKRRPGRYREFPYSAARAARAYLLELRAAGLDPVLSQHADTIVTRVRARGFPDLHFTAGSYAEAERIAAKVEEERSRGLFIDYTRSVNVTSAQLIARYIDEECPKHKGGMEEVYRLRAFLADSRGELARERALSTSAKTEANVLADKPNGRKRAKREPIGHLEWLHKPFAWVEPTDIEGYIRDRLEDVAPATVDRELDLLAQVFNVAIKTWRYNVCQHPMAGVRRPKYFNERDRRVSLDEERRLIAAARDLDRQRSQEIALAKEFARYREEAALLPTRATRQRFLAAARKRAQATAGAACRHIAIFETFIRFQLCTAARRGEALALVWKCVDLDARKAFFPETKNGRPRAVPLRDVLVDALSNLPGDQERVFPISIDELKNAWRRICERAEVEDLHIHDLRHEAISRIADTGQFTLVDLQTISGHRDPRMLMRYAHQCATQLARRLDEAFEQRTTYAHKGRVRLSKDASVSIGELLRAGLPQDESSLRTLALLREALGELKLAAPTVLVSERQSAGIGDVPRSADLPSAQVIAFPKRGA